MMTKFLYCSLHALCMMAICYLWLGSGYNLDAEEKNIRVTSTIASLMSDKKEADISNFIFIDVSGDKMLVDREDGSGQNVVVDRKQLAALFSNLKGTNCKTILCDLLFEEPTITDTLLQATINDLKNIVVPYRLNNNGLASPVFTGVKPAYSGYYISSGFMASGIFLKYKLISYDNLKSLPLVMYETEFGDAEDLFGFLWINKQAVLNNIIPQFRITQEELYSDTSRIWPLNYFTYIANPGDYVDGKYVVIGNFQDDIHETVSGKMAGPLLIANIFMSLQLGDNTITFQWLLYIFLCFIMVSILILYPPKLFLTLFKKLEYLPFGFFLEELVIFYLLLTVISLFSLILFDKYLEIMILTIYVSIIFFYRDWKKRRLLLKLKNDRK